MTGRQTGIRLNDLCYTLQEEQRLRREDEARRSVNPPWHKPAEARVVAVCSSPSNKVASALVEGRCKRLTTRK